MKYKKESGLYGWLLYRFAFVDGERYLLYSSMYPYGGTRKYQRANLKRDIRDEWKEAYRSMRYRWDGGEE